MSNLDLDAPKPFPFEPESMTYGDATVWIRESGIQTHPSIVLDETTVGGWRWVKRAVYSFTPYRGGYSYHSNHGSSWLHADNFCGFSRN